MDFLAYVSSYFPHLSADASRNFSSGSSLFLSALRSLASRPTSAVPSSSFPQVSSVSAPPFVSPPDAPASRFPPPLPQPSALPPPSSASSLPSATLPCFPTASLPPPLGFPSVLSALPSAPVFRSFASSLPPLSAPPPVFSVSSLAAHASALGLGPLAGVAAAAAVPAAAAPALFRPLAVPVSSAPATFPSAPLYPPSTASTFAPSGVPPRFPHASASSAPLVVSPSRLFGAALDDAFDPGYPDVMPRDLEAPAPAVFTESYRSEICRMLSYMIDLFPQAEALPGLLLLRVHCLKIYLPRLRFLCNRFIFIGLSVSTWLSRILTLVSLLSRVGQVCLFLFAFAFFGLCGQGRLYSGLCFTD